MPNPAVVISAILAAVYGVATLAHLGMWLKEFGLPHWAWALYCAALAAGFAWAAWRFSEREE